MTGEAASCNRQTIRLSESAIPDGLATADLFPEYSPLPPLLRAKRAAHPQPLQQSAPGRGGESMVGKIPAYEAPAPAPSPGVHAQGNAVPQAPPPFAEASPGLFSALLASVDAPPLASSSACEKSGKKPWRCFGKRWWSLWHSVSLRMNAWRGRRCGCFISRNLSNH